MDEQQTKQNPSKKILGGYYEVEYAPDAEGGLAFLEKMRKEEALVLLDHSKSTWKPAPFFDGYAGKHYQLTYKTDSNKWFLENA